MSTRRSWLAAAPILLPAPLLPAALLLGGTVTLLALLAGCVPKVKAPGEDPSSADVLFVGNSLTSANDLPGTVARIAATAGVRLEVTALTRPGTSLEDHWRGDAVEVIRRTGAGFVVLQQGPSSLPENAEHLARWSRRLAEVIWESGGQPVLLMVWPSRRRWAALEDVRASYAEAARQVNGLLVPAGDVWEDAWRRDPGLPLTRPDGFHPTPLGTFAAALTAFGVLADLHPAEIPCPPLAGAAERRELVCESVREVLARSSRWRRIRTASGMDGPHPPNSRPPRPPALR